MSKTFAPSFSVDALLCAEYCYYILLAGVYHSEEKIRQALTSSIDESPVAEFDRRVHSLISKLKKETTNSTKYIEPEAFEFVRKGLCDKATDDFKENLKKSIKTLSKHNSATGNQEKVREVMGDLTSSFVACLMHLPQNKLQKLMEDSLSINALKEIKQRLKENDYREMIQKWNSILQEGETSLLVENLIRSGRGAMGRMKIVRAKSMKTADQFYFTLRLTRSISSLDECFEVIRDYGGIQIEKQLMKSSSPFFKKLQPEICADKFDCPCPGLKLQAYRKKCTKCNHVHKWITQYEDLENLACVLILVEKGRMGDTFPQSFDCLDLRLSHDSSCEFKEGSSLHLSTIIQELGRMCRYSKFPASETPYVLVGRVLFKTLQTSLKTSPSMNAISCQKADRYMTKSRRRKDEKCSSLRWLDYEAQKDSYDYQNVKKHYNRILLHAEPQIGKTGAYLCLIRELRRDICGKVPLSATPTFEDGIFYRHKESRYSQEFLFRDTGERHDWEFPYWKTIKDSPSLYDEPATSRKYSIEGCFYTHDVEECPSILVNPEEDKTTIDHQYQERECAEGLRAWHWYHYEKCVDCGRRLQGKGPVLETFTVSIDGIPVTVKCSVPSSRQSFKHLLEQLKSTSSTEEATKKQNPSSTPFWIFHASHRDDPRKCTLNYHHVMQEKGQVPTYAQIAVVRKVKFDAYRSTWGKVLTIVQLPDALPNCELEPNERGVGYAKLFVQKMSFALNLEYIFVIDDNVVVMSEAVFTKEPSSPAERILKDEKGVMKMQRCSFLKPLSHLQKIAEGKETPPIDETKYEPHPLTDQFESEEFPLYSYTGPAKLFGNKQHESYGVLGFIRSVPVAVAPFSRTQVYAAVLLNVKSTVERGVFYRPWPCWEDLRFNDDCDKAGLWVVKCNRYSFLKVQYKDWINNLAPPKIFEWRDDSILAERPLVSELPKEFEESIILEHLRNFVNTQGPEKCFKGCIGYAQEERVKDTVSPARIVQEVEAKQEPSAKGTPVFILSFSVGNLTTNDIELLTSRFCSTKEKVVTVTSTKEVLEEWPEMKLTKSTIPKAIFFSREMRNRNSKFTILSAADPKRHRLRYILIQASFPQEDKDYQADITSSVKNSLLNIRNEPRMDRISLANNTQDISKEKKSRKRSLRESFDDSVEMKRRKTNDDCNQQIESLLPERCNEVIIIEEGFSPLQSSPKHFQNFGTKSKPAKAVSSQFENKSKAIDLITIESMNSVLTDEEMTSEKMDVSSSVQERSEKVHPECQVSIVSEDKETLGRKRVARNDDTEGTNDVTKDIVSLWREFRNLQTSSGKDGETTGSNDLTMKYITEKLTRFTTDQLQGKDEKGFNAILKACSLPSMSPHVVQYLITTRKVDINCELPQNFDRNPSAKKGLIPGMSALSVAIKSGNVKLVPTFTRRGNAISVQSVDDDGNTALHHCVLSMSKFSFRKLFPLYKPLKWKNMRNEDGKNPLDIARGMQGLSEGKERCITFMCEEMMKKTKTKRVEEKK